MPKLRRDAPWAAILLLMILFVSCGGDQDTEPSEGEAAQAVEKIPGPVAQLPYHSTLRLSTRLVSHGFMVGHGKSLIVTANGRWDRPTACRAPTYSITLHTVSSAVFGAELGAEVSAPHYYPSTGATHQETWPGLTAGEYALEILSGQDDPHCTLAGEIAISTP